VGNGDDCRVNGSVNAMHGHSLRWAGWSHVALQLGEIIFGGVGSGLGMIVFAIIMFIAGLMVAQRIPWQRLVLRNEKWLRWSFWSAMAVLIGRWVAVGTEGG
jgi:hypothetical protein